MSEMSEQSVNRRHRERLVPVNIRLPSGARDALRQQAKREGLTLRRPQWLKPEFRCLVPATSLGEWTDSGPKVPHWFALDDKRPLFAFVGIWRPWIGERKGVAAEHQHYAFLTTEANNLVRPIHAKAMPVMLCDPEAWDIWLTGSVEEALELQSPLSAEGLARRAAEFGIDVGGPVDDIVLGIPKRN
jgi:putative SOS response-associated peptidase YedK